MVSKKKSLQINENLVLSQSADGLTFGTDAYMLAAYMKGGSKQSAADLGSGTGVISLLCQSKEKFNHIYAIEIQERFASFTCLHLCYVGNVAIGDIFLFK